MFPADQVFSNEHHVSHRLLSLYLLKELFGNGNKATVWGFGGAVFFSDVKMGFHIYENPYHNHCNHSLEEEHNDLGMLQFSVVWKTKTVLQQYWKILQFGRYLVEFK